MTGEREGDGGVKCMRILLNVLVKGCEMEF